MFEVIFLVFITFILYASYKPFNRIKLKKREQFIDNYKFPKKVEEMILKTYPHLNSKDISLVLKRLREYFHISNIAIHLPVDMLDELKVRANSIDVLYQSFIKILLEEGLKSRALYK